MGEGTRIDRLTGPDLASLWPEDFGWPADIGALAIMDGSGLVDAAGQVRIDAVRDRIRRRLHLVLRFRQLVRRPRWGLGGPLWVDAPSFALEDHVRVSEVDPPGDERQFLEACEELRGRRLDRSKPLWELWLLSGLRDGRIGMFFRVHHSIADGMAGVATIGALLDLAPDTMLPEAPPWAPAPAASVRELLVDNIRRRGEAVVRAVSKLVHPIRVLRRARRVWPGIKEIFGEGKAPATSLNRPVGWERLLGVVRGRLELAKDVAHAHDAKVNDVVLAAVAGGCGEVLRARGEPVEDIFLRAMVPVSLHSEGAEQARGNLNGGMSVPMPIGEPDVFRRLELIAAETRERKKTAKPAFGAGILALPLVQRAALRYMRRQRLVNVYVTNVPGPPFPLYLGRAHLLEMFALVPISGNVTLGVGVLSYAGQLNFTVVADRDALADIDRFTDGLRTALHELGVAEETDALAPSQFEVSEVVPSR